MKDLAGRKAQQKGERRGVAVVGSPWKTVVELLRGKRHRACETVNISEKNLQYF